MKSNIIFATGSAQRKRICARHGIKCKFTASRARESIKGANAKKIAISNAMKKASKIFMKNKEAVVIGADTIVFCDGKVIGKPNSTKNAREIIALLAGKKHAVITGVCIISKFKSTSYCDVSYVIFKKLSARQIDNYIKSDRWIGKAGGYGVQSDSRMLISKITGSRENVEGLDGARLKSALKKFKKEFF